jgi:Uma2 family endonuclease
MTAKQLAGIPDDGKRYELVLGELHMMSPAGHEHGRVAMRIGSILEQHVRMHQLGTVYAAETGFLLSREPDTVRAPDAAFVSRERLTQAVEVAGYLPLAPNLVAEVVSPHDTFTQVEEKAHAWLEAGTSMVLVVDPGTRTVRVYRTKDNIAVLYEGDQLDAGDVVPGWKLPVGELFT